MSDHHQEDHVIQYEYGSFSYGTSPQSDNINPESYSELLSSTKSMNDLYQHDYDCSICLERLQDPVWCGQGNCSMRSCRNCLIKWCEKNTYKCPHCQIVLGSQSQIQNDDELRIKIEEEQQLYPHVVKKVKEQGYVISLQQKQIAMMRKRIESLEISRVKVETEKMIAMYACLLFLALWMFSFWSASLFNHSY